MLACVRACTGVCGHVSHTCKTHLPSSLRLARRIILCAMAVLCWQFSAHSLHRVLQLDLGRVRIDTGSEGYILVEHVAAEVRITVTDRSNRVVVQERNGTKGIRVGEYRMRSAVIPSASRGAPVAALGRA